MSDASHLPRLTAACAALLLSACSSMGPLPAQPPATTPAMPAAWQSPQPHGGQVGDLARWWSQFNDPALSSLMDAAQAASPSLSAARVRLARAQAARVAAGAASWPSLDAVGSATTGRSVPGVPTGSSLSLGAQASWELDLFGAVAAGRDAAQARLEAAQAGWHEARVSVAAEVASSYTALRACEAQLALTRLDTQSRSETARLTDQSARAGFTAPADAALARAGAAQARSQLLSQQAQCSALVKSLVEVTDRSEPELRQQLAAGTGQLPKPAPISPGGVPASLLAQRPDLTDAASAVSAAAADRNQARAREGLQVTLAGSLSAVSLRSGGISTNGSTWALGPLLVTFPLFDRGTRVANTQASQAAYADAVAQYRAQIRRAVREVETALVNLEATGLRDVDTQAAARDFEASLVATEARQRGGLATLFDLEAARRNAVLAQSALIELQRERVAAWIALYRALGGGWSADAPTTVSTAAKP